MRYFIDISYLGTNYHGWQIQKNAKSVQGELHKSLTIHLQQEITTTGSGRTDAGVHAAQQIVHFDFDKEIDEVKFLSGINKLLPVDISVNKLYLVDDEASARYDAISRLYEYTIIHHKNPFIHEQVALYFKKPDIDLLNKGAKIIQHYTDFECFSKVKTDVNNFDCTIMECFWEQRGEQLVFSIKANRFLRGMVRAIVGTLLEVGYNKISLKQFEDIIKSKDRRNAGTSVPAAGLSLKKVVYE